ncbi:hypothetical protein DFH08DRAFT_956697 [Mycena albidolilacea]|uniref:Uncharacterized protein n=1 Tax=Mycena albidolilacea TaxID=1033008 RepID=A0AAD7EWI6_9AGAR|nr:hypothetical protein DFH08DRAFT_956697 [Mycena albidolilacea]
MLEIVLEAMCNPTNEAPWIHLASDVFRSQTLILAKSPQHTQLKQQYPLVRFWTPADFDTDSDSAPCTKIKKLAGGTDKKSNVNNEGQYVKHADRTVVGGIEFGKCKRQVTHKLAHIGKHVCGALIYMLKLHYPHLGLCVEHWQVLRIVQDRYRFWATPFRDRLISYDTPIPGPLLPGPSPPDSLRIQIPPPSDERVLPPNTEPNALLADMEQSTVPPPNTEPNALLADMDTDVVPDADGTPLVQPNMFDDIVVEPPPTPPASTPGSAPAPPLPLPVTMSHISKGKLCAPHSKHFTARNLHLAIYCVDVPCSEAEYKIEWSCLQSEDAACVKVYEKLSRAVTSYPFRTPSDSDDLRSRLYPTLPFLYSPLFYWFVLHMIPSDS